MANRILWIDDDYFAIEGLFLPLRKAGFTVEHATSAIEGYHKAQHWQNYDLIAVDLILPITNEQEVIPDIVKKWQDERENPQVGVGLVRWLRVDVQATCPIIILSIVSDPISTYRLEHLGLNGYIPKIGLLPSSLKEKIMVFTNNKGLERS